jgi:hypothetical protein
MCTVLFPNVEYIIIFFGNGNKKGPTNKTTNGKWTFRKHKAV